MLFINIRIDTKNVNSPFKKLKTHQPIRTKMTTKKTVTALGILLLACGGASAEGKGGRKEDEKQGSPPPFPVRDEDFYDNGTPPEAKVALGNFLFFDKELSGNRNISCATCHHSLTDTGDGLSLPVGEGGRGLGVTRDTGRGADAIHERVPRNAPPVFNLGAREFARMFHDGRVEADPSQPSGFRSPAGGNLPAGLDNPLAVQAMFPVTSATEMAGQSGENPIADASGAGNLAGPGGVWEQLALRLQGKDPSSPFYDGATSPYLHLFMAAYPGQISTVEDITFVHAANAIAAFEASAWRADKSPFDRYLRGDKDGMSKEAENGMKLFYGKAGCANCHSGKFQTDQDFHSIAMPQIGPGKGAGLNGHDDFGREAVTGNVADHRKFRTPSLRNVALTGPWGHDGAFNTLEGIVRHHLNAPASLNAYDTAEAVLTPRPDLDAIDTQIHQDAASRADIASSNELAPRSLSDQQVAQLVGFLRSLTDPGSIDLRTDVPVDVPSGLPLAE
jgi:cytochrome c peroxidase